ncbi:MAG: caspase family protein [Pseudomonadota bacterium]
MNIQRLVGFCSISCAKFSAEAGLRPLLGARADADRLEALGRDIVLSTDRAAVIHIDSKGRNAVFADFCAWVAKLDEGVAVVYIGTHGFHGSNGLTLQFYDCVAADRDFSGIALKQFYHILAKCPSHFLVLLDCCREEIADGGGITNDFHPENVTVIYACDRGEKTRDFGHGLSEVFMTAFLHEAENESSVLKSDQLVDLLGRRYAEIGKKLLLHGSRLPEAIQYSDFDSNKYKTTQLFHSVEIRSRQLDEGQYQSLASKCRFLSAELSVGIEVKKIEGTDIANVLIDGHALALAYTLVQELCDAHDFFEVVRFRYVPDQHSKVVRRIVDSGFVRISGGAVPFYQSVHLDTQHRAYIQSSSVAVRFCDGNEVTVPVPSNGGSLYHLLQLREA